MTHQYMENKLNELEKRIETLEKELILDEIRTEVEKEYLTEGHTVDYAVVHGIPYYFLKDSERR